MIYGLSFELETQVSLGNRDSTHSREDVIARFNDHCGDLCDEHGNPSFFGVTEGVLLAEEATEDLRKILFKPLLPEG